MTIRPARSILDHPHTLLLLAILAATLVLAGPAGARVEVCASPTCWGIPTIYSDEWDGGSDLGTMVQLAECSGDYDDRHCTPHPHTFTYTLTIPDTVRMERIVSAEIALRGLGGDFYGNCDGEAFGDNDHIIINGHELAGCPVNQPESLYFWTLNVNPSLLHTGVNTIVYEASPWHQIDQYGNLIYGGETGVWDIDVLFEFTTPPAPELEDLGISPALFLTGHDMTVHPVITGESPDWEIAGITYYLTDRTSGAEEFHRMLPHTEDLTYSIPPGAYGKKWLTAKMHALDRMTGQWIVSEVTAPVTIYFEKGIFPDWIDDDGDGRPNWLEYWAEDGAVPLLTSSILYNASGTGYGISYGSGVIFLEPLAATYHYAKPLRIPSTSLSPGGETFGGPDIVGIDCAAEVMAHEYYHDWVDAQWRQGGLFYNMDDTDREILPDGSVKDDRLPDFYEESISLTEYFDDTDTWNLSGIKSGIYEFYGDQEYMAMRAGSLAKGVAENDWAYPGKQAGSRQDIPGIFPPQAVSCTGSCDIYAPGSPDAPPSGIVETARDTNSNGLFEDLATGNDITIVREGTYEIAAVLTGDRGSGPEVIAVQRNQSVLEPGSYPFSAVFPGTAISSAGIDGPYTVTLTWRHDYQENGVPPSVSWQTGPYVSSRFEPVSAGFAGAASAARDGAGLKAVVPLTVNRAGEYTVEGHLQDPDGVTLAHAAATAVYPAGFGEAALMFDGNAIAAHRRDGTYRLVSFRILDASGTTAGRLADAGSVAISAGEYGTLQPIITGTYADDGAQPADDGRFQVLTIGAVIDAPSAGDYFYSASLFDAENGFVEAISGGYPVPSTGEATLHLNFSGRAIYNNGVSGVFTLRSFEVIGPSGTDRLAEAFVTGAYDYTSFSRPPVVITGNVSDYPVDWDGDGLYDALRIGFDADVGKIGGDTISVLFAANLTGPGGMVIARGSAYPSLAGDQSHHVTLDFAGTDISGREIDGPFRVAGLTAGTVNPHYYHEPYMTAGYAHAQFEPAAVLAGFVWDDSGFPVTGATVGAFGKSGPVNAAGYYRLIYGESHTGGVTAVPPAESGLEGGYEIRSVNPGSTTFCNFTLSRYAGLYGRVIAENGTALTTGFVSADGPSDKVFTLGTWNNGSYSLLKLKPGTYKVTYIPATGSDLVANATRDMVLAPLETRGWNITAFNPRSLAGTVRDIYGDPVADAEVSVTEGPVIVTGSYAIKTSAAGAYAFPRHAPGASTIVVDPPYGSRLVTNTSTVTIAMADTAVVHDILMMPDAVAPEVWWPAIDPPEGPAPLAVSFTDRSKGYPTTWLWDFGDGTTSDLRNPVHTYTAAGTYTVSLSASNAYGSDSYTFADCVRVTDPRIVLPAGRLEPGTTAVFPVSAGDITDAAEVRLALLYDPAVVRLDGVEPASGLVSAAGSSIDNVTGTAAIVLAFASDLQSIGDATALAGLTFTATGSPGSTSPLTATYADEVSCAGGEGCWDGARRIYRNLSVIPGSIRIAFADPLPVAGFTASPRAGNAPLTVAFDSSASQAIAPTSYLWSFGDGGTSPLESPAHTYSAPGMYDVSLTVANASGSDTLTLPGYIAVSPSGAQETYVFIRSFGHEGSGSSGEAEFLYPEGIAIHPSGNLYIVDPGNSRVQVVTPDGTFIRAFGSEGTGSGQFLYPRGIAADAAGSVYVADIQAHRVQKFSADGTFLTSWGTFGSGTGQFRNPGRVAAGPDGNIYVTELGNNRVQKFDTSGTYLGQWGTTGSADGQFTFPGGIATDGSGSVYVAEGSPNHRVQKFDKDGIFITKWGGMGSADGQFLFPAGIATGADGSVYVADSDNNRVQKFSPAGQYITQWGTSGTGAGQFSYPYDVAVSGAGLVYVADSENNRIQVFGRGPAESLTAGFTANATTGMAPLTVRFTDTSSGSPTGWTWDFGDGATATDRNPVHTYTTPGTCTVSLSVTDGSITDTLIRAGLITVMPPVGDEEYGPGGDDPAFDGNGDGIPDWQQENVSSLHTTTGSYVTLAVPLPAALSGVLAVENPSPSDAPPAVLFPAGFLSFSVTGIAPGGSTTVLIFLPAETATGTYFKYGPSPDNPDSHWYEFADDGSTGAEVEGPVITLHMTDGARGDSDLAADGEITDPGAPARITNRPPVLDPIGNRTVAGGETLQFTVTASDPDGDTVTFTAEPLPEGAAFTGGSFSWTPSFDQAGSCAITFTATDPGDLSDDETIKVTVTGAGDIPVPLPGYSTPPTDPDGDGVCEDLNGNGRLDFADVVLYFTQMTWIAANEPVAAFDLNGNSRIDFADIVALFNEI